MRSIELAWDDAPHRASTLLLEWSGGIAVGEALSQLPRENVPPMLDGQPLDPRAELDQITWRRGAVLGRTDDGGDIAFGEHIRIVGGPHAGHIAALEQAGQLVPTLGLSRAGDGVWVQPRSGSDARYEGVPITSRRLWQPGDVVQAGTTLVTWYRGSTAVGDTTSIADGRLGFARPPRILSSAEPAEVSVPTPPRPPPRRPLPWLVAITPLVLGVVLFVVTRSAYALLFSLLSPVLLLGSWWSDRRSTHGQHHQEMAEHEESVRRTERRLGELVAEESHRRRDQTPDPATLLLQTIGARAGLWQRRREDADHLDLTVGMGDRPAAVRLRSEGGRGDGRPVPLVPYVPVSLPLRGLGVVGLCGHREHVIGLARWWVGQTAGSASPRDVRLVVLSIQPSAVEDWAWARWLPHTGSYAGDAHAARTLVAVDQQTIRTRLDELSALVDQRAAVRGDGPDYVVLLDGAAALRTEPTCARLLADGPSVGMHIICVDDAEQRLPEECQAVVTTDDSAFVTVRSSGEPGAETVLAHQVSTTWVNQMAHALAPLVDATPAPSTDRAIPTSARLLELLELDPPTAHGVLKRWAATPTTVARIGIGLDGPLELDLRGDGPHALVAGTTGAGKSELLQALVASLAAANRPDAMTFLLVDYKGGAAFGECAGLPHTAGLVTDLDAALTARALESLTAELRRREETLGAAGAKDLEAYAAAGSVAGPLPRLVIVVDEFAALVDELPEFVPGLVGIAQRGRSLGVHLVLATQRPSGVVSPEIRANTNLRIALRVTDDAESVDVIDAPDSARIPRSLPGRAYLRTGHGELRPFQTARIAGPAPGQPVSTEAPALRLEILDLPALGRPWSRAAATADGSEVTDLGVFVVAVREASQRAEVEAPPPPWLPPLPAELPWSAMNAPGAFGLEDRPVVQRQPPAVLGDGHLLVAGAARSGRTTLLRTLAVSLASSSTVDSVHLYAIDGGNGPLANIEGLPHVGAVVASTDVGRVDRLLSRLAVEVRRRQDAAAVDEPALVLLVDRWESFVGRYDDVDGGRLVDLLLDLVRDGLSVGLRVVVTGDRSLLVGRLAGLVDDKICLRLADVGDYALAGIDPRRVSLAGPAGRGYRAPSGVELQVAVTTAEDLRAVIDTAKAPEQKRPFRIDPIPRSLRLDQAESLPWAGPGRVLVGVGGDDLMRIGVDLARVGPGFVVTGPRRSGRSTALVTMAYSALMSGARVVALAPRGGPLLALPADERIPSDGLTLFTARNGGGDEGTAGADTYGIDPNALVEAIQTPAGTPVVVVVDDAERLKDTDVAPVLSEVLRQGDPGRALVIAAATDDLSRAVRGYLNDVRSSRSGLLLTPDTHLVGELLGVRLPRSAAFRVPVGRGLLVVDGDVTVVQVPLPHVLVRP